MLNPRSSSFDRHFGILIILFLHALLFSSSLRANVAFLTESRDEIVLREKKRQTARSPPPPFYRNTEYITGLILL